MAITAAQAAQARRAILDVEQRVERYRGLVQDVEVYIGGGSMSRRLQEELRTFLSTRLHARLDAYKASIDADVTAIRAIVTDYALPE